MTNFILRLMRENDINLLVDVGANQGQYAERMRTIGFQGGIHSLSQAAKPMLSCQRGPNEMVIGSRTTWRLAQ